MYFSETISNKVEEFGLNKSLIHIAMMKLIDRLRNEKQFVEDIPFMPEGLCKELISLSNSNFEDNILILYSHELSVIFNNRGFKNLSFATRSFCQKSKTVCEGLNIKYYVLEDIKEMKFDIIIGNPPYSGNLHQKIFNIAFDLLIDNGTLVFIQPASQYFNKKDNRKRNDEKLMLETIKKYNTEIIFKPKDIFRTHTILSSLSITKVIKTSDHETINKITYENGTSYLHAKLEDINMAMINPIIFENLKAKYQKLISINGCLEELGSYTPNEKMVDLARIRGHGFGSDDHYTFIPKNMNNKRKLEKDYGLIVNNINEVENAYDYLRSYAARFGLVFLKFNSNLQCGELKAVPKVDFSRTYSDEELFEMLDLTSDEILVIKETIVDYYNRG